MSEGSSDVIEDVRLAPSLSVETCFNDGCKLNQYIDLIMV